MALLSFFFPKKGGPTGVFSVHYSTCENMPIVFITAEVEYPHMCPRDFVGLVLVSSGIECFRFVRDFPFPSRV